SRRFASQLTETGANRMAWVGCVAAAARRLVSAPHTLAIANPSQTCRIISVQTTPGCLRRWRSRLQSRPPAQILLVSTKFVRLKRSVTRLPRRFPLPGVGFDDFLCPLMMPTRLAAGLEPLNAPNAGHRSPRSARFHARNLGPPLDRPLAGAIKRNKEPPK